MNTCQCIKDYKVSTRDYISPNVHSEIYQQTIFEQGEIYYYFNRTGIYYVTDKPEYLRNVDRYNNHIEELTKEEFNIYFYEN
jgi:hypothetical protein